MEIITPKNVKKGGILNNLKMFGSLTNDDEAQKQNKIYMNTKDDVKYRRTHFASHQEYSSSFFFLFKYFLTNQSPAE